MDNDKIFAAYAVTLVAGVTSVISASVMAGLAALPSLGVFVEHLALSLAFRGAYKSFAGFDWVYVAALNVGLITAPDVAPEPGIMAGAGI